ncbi:MULTISPECIES: phosphopantetheine-binding protein [unclassified Pseudovibrio]|uniref:acyl carrier protein n=1 Tax=unclassified Pseudovibrio TaxID=2627060 RepID=UPI0007AE73D4|nr:MULTISPECIES: phosphopantetheine-binding protein [unclassified Pseudovibrio]KZL02223.1 Acyl carrier protein [Pseudovibrio sp. W74]KZL08232.1 Acyl carrier protein [Pseudovibrio sp. Ad14]
MTFQFSAEDISKIITEKVIYEGLELEELGIELDEITPDKLLFDEDGLALDSVDALEVIAGVQREFNITFPEVDQEFIEKNCSTIEQLTQTVMSFSKATAA